MSPFRASEEYPGKASMAFRLSAEARKRLRERAEAEGVSMTEVMERLIRAGELAKELPRDHSSAAPLLFDVLAVEPDVKRVYDENPLFRKLVQRLWSHLG